MDPELAALVEQHKEHFAFENGKVKCLLNGHSFPARLDLVEAFTRWVLLQHQQARSGISRRCGALGDWRTYGLQLA
jgi:hypothetical protein